MNNLKDSSIFYFKISVVTTAFILIAEPIAKTLQIDQDTLLLYMTTLLIAISSILGLIGLNKTYKNIKETKKEVAKCVIITQLKIPVLALSLCAAVILQTIFKVDMSILIMLPLLTLMICTLFEMQILAELNEKHNHNEEIKQ